MLKVSTKYYGPTETQGSRVVATLNKDKRKKATLGFHSEQDVHHAACQKLIEKLGGSYEWIPCYKIVRKYQRNASWDKVLHDGKTLQEVQEHCKNPETSSSTCQGEEAVKHTEKFGPWFDCYTFEGFMAKEEEGV